MSDLLTMVLIVALSSLAGWTLAWGALTMIFRALERSAAQAVPAPSASNIARM